MMAYANHPNSVSTVAEKLGDYPYPMQRKSGTPVSQVFNAYVAKEASNPSFGASSATTSSSAAPAPPQVNQGAGVGGSKGKGKAHDVGMASSAPGDAVAALARSSWAQVAKGMTPADFTAARHAGISSALAQSSASPRGQAGPATVVAAKELANNKLKEDSSRVLREKIWAEELAPTSPPCSDQDCGPFVLFLRPQWRLLANQVVVDNCTALLPAHVMLQVVPWNYCTYEHGARLIVRYCDGTTDNSFNRGALLSVWGSVVEWYTETIYRCSPPEDQEPEPIEALDTFLSRWAEKALASGRDQSKDMAELASDPVYRQTMRQADLERGRDYEAVAKEVAVSTARAFALLTVGSSGAAEAPSGVSSTAQSGPSAAQAQGRGTGPGPRGTGRGSAAVGRGQQQGSGSQRGGRGGQGQGRGASRGRGQVRGQGQGRGQAQGRGRGQGRGQGQSQGQGQDRGQRGSARGGLSSSRWSS